MKKQLLVATLLLMTAFSASSQTFQWVTNDTIDENLAHNTTVQFPMYQEAIGNDTVTLAIEVIYNDLPGYWDGMLCIYGTCLGVIPVVGTTAEMTPISGSDQGMVRLTVNPIGGSEVAKLQVYVYDIDFPNDGDTATFLLNRTLGMDEANPLESNLELFPNPSQEDVFVSSPTGLDLVSIYSLSGQMIESYNLNNEISTTINVRNIPAGVYMICIEDKDGNIVNKKFIKE